MASDITLDGPRFHGTDPRAPELPHAGHGPAGEDLAGMALDHPLRLRWWLAMAAAMGLLGVLTIALGFVLWYGVGMWGNNIPVTWALDIVGYDFWIGIACGALLISAVLLLTGAASRSVLSRTCDTIAVLAAAAAGTYPIVHLGRPWYFYWNLPYPNTFLLWPQFRSPLFWDAIDILSFLGISLSVFYVGLLPDLATMRDRATERVRLISNRAAARNREPRETPEWRSSLLRAQLYGIASLGWRGSGLHWRRWAEVYRILAVAAILVVASLQTGAAVMFAGAAEPGWHDTLMPVSFLAVAALSGVATVTVVLTAIRAAFGLDSLITRQHLEVLGLLLLGLALLNVYCNAQEAMTTLLGGDSYDRAVLARRIGGPHAWAFWTLVIGGLVSAQALWVPALRRSPLALGVIGLLVCIGMWADHFMIIVVTLQHDYLPPMDWAYSINIWGLATFAGSLGLLLVLLLLALRYLPVLSILEVRQFGWMPSQRPREQRDMAAGRHG